jgi:O-antigen ligase
MKKILPTLELITLSLMVISLPSLEAPKNIFLVGYLLTRMITEVYQLKEGRKLWGHWDNLFATIVFTALLTTIFAGFSGHEEWKGYRVLLTGVLTGWALSRTCYSMIQYQLLFKLIVLSTLPPLIWGLYELYVIKSKIYLEIHSVGHVNHSAIYLTIIFGACVSWFISKINYKKERLIFNWKTIFLGVLSLLFFISLIIGSSRAAFGISIILGLVLFLLLTKKNIVKIITITAVLSFLTILVALKPPIVQEQIDSQHDNNILSDRGRVWNVSIEAAKWYPLLGIGLSNWHFINYDQLKKSVIERKETFDPENYLMPGHSHNLYLSALVERGVVGLMMTFLFMIAWIHRLIKTFTWAKESREKTYLWGGSFSAWIATFGIGLVNTTFHHEHAILACLFLGIHLSCTRLLFKKDLT